MIEWIDGFDTYGSGGTDTSAALAGNWAEFGALGAITFDNSVARTGTFSAHASAQNANTTMRRVFSTTLDTVVVGYALWLANLPITVHVAHQFIDEDNNAQLSVAIISTGAIRVYASDLSTILGETDGPVCTPESWDFIEAKYTPTSIVIRVNRTEVLSITGMTNAPVAQWGIKGSTFGDTADWWLDDIYCCNTSGGTNTDFIGDAHVYTLLPNGDDTPVDWTNSTGSTSWSLIDEVGPNTTDYIFTDTASKATQVTLTDLPTEAVNIYGVQSYSYMKKTAGGVGSVKQSIVSGASATDDDGHDLSTDWNYYKGTFEEDPAGGSWTRTAVNAAKLRVTRTS